MMTEGQVMPIVYFLAFFKYIFLIFYLTNIYGLLFNMSIYDYTLKLVIILENVFIFLMGLLLLYRFSKDTIQVTVEERLLIYTLIVVIVFNGAIKIGSVEWF